MGQRDRRRRITIREPGQVRALEERLRAAAAAAVQKLEKLVRESDPLAVLRALKFEAVGSDPLEPEQPESLLDQVHQTQACRAALRALDHLLEQHPEHAPYHLNLGTAVVPDIESADGALVAEVWAGMSVRDNRKVDTDLARLRASDAPLRYFFYGAAAPDEAPVDPEIVIVRVDL